MKKVQNWGRTVNFTPSHIKYPTTTTEIESLVKDAIQHNQKIRLIGSGHSWTPLIPTNQILVSLDHFQGIEQVDKQNLTVVVKAGTKLKKLGELLYEQGLAMENLGDIDVQSLGGSLNTGTHGTGTSFGTLSTQVLEITLVNGKGETITCSETHNPRLFKAAQVGLGALGIVTHYKMRIVPTFKLKCDVKAADLDETLTRIDEYNQKYRNFEFYWLPYTKKVMLKLVDTTTEAPKNIGFLKYLNDVVIENIALSIFGAVGGMLPHLSQGISRTMAKFIMDATYINHSHLIFASVRWVKFFEMEYNIPAQHFSEVIKKMEQNFEKHQFQVPFPIECRFVKQDDILISPANGRDSAYIAIHQFRNMKNQPYFDKMEKVFQSVGGRPHYGKMNSATYGDFGRMYGDNWSQFLEIRKENDPQGIFLNEYLSQIFGLNF